MTEEELKTIKKRCRPAYSLPKALQTLKHISHSDRIVIVFYFIGGL
jgi:hypothetical protein